LKTSHLKLLTSNFTDLTSIRKKVGEFLNSYLQVGKIINTHGLKGEVKVLPLTDDPKRFDSLEDVYIVPRDSVSEDLVLSSGLMKIESLKYFQDKVIVKFTGVESIENAEKLKEHYIVIHRKDAISLPENSFFICDLINCEVYDVEGKVLGVLKEVIQTGSNDVYVIKKDEQKDILLPALKSVVKSIEIAQKKIIVELPKGLL
jgi:16S rRNA processing protein RimM